MSNINIYPSNSLMSDLELKPKSAPLDRVAFEPLPAQPTVSIVVPSFRQGAYIRATIESILSQNYRPLKIHVIDGGSDDNTVEELKSFGDLPELEWISEPDRGVVHAVNKGLARVTGDIVGIQSSDDMYCPGTIDRIVQEFQAHQQMGLIYGDTSKVDAEGRELERNQIGPYSLENIFLFRTWIPQPSAFFRREMLDICGGWDEGIPYAPDTDLWIRMAFRTEVRKLEAFLSERRMHDQQRDTQSAKIVRDFTQMIDQSTDILQASASIKSAAQAARHLIRVRYNPPKSDWYAAWHQCQAGRCDSRVRRTNSVIRHLLLPTRRVLSGVKQRTLQMLHLQKSTATPSQ